MGITYAVRRDLPQTVVSRRALLARVKRDEWGRSKSLPGGGLAVIVSDLGFMSLTLHLAIYEASPRFLRSDSLTLVSSGAYETTSSVTHFFDQL